MPLGRMGVVQVVIEVTQVVRGLCVCRLPNFRDSAKTHLLNHHIKRSGIHLSWPNGTI